MGRVRVGVSGVVGRILADGNRGRHGKVVAVSGFDKRQWGDASRVDALADGVGGVGGIRGGGAGLRGNEAESMARLLKR